MLWPVAHITQYAWGPAMPRWICKHAEKLKRAAASVPRQVPVLDFLQWVDFQHGGSPAAAGSLCSCPPHGCQGCRHSWSPKRGKWCLVSAEHTSYCLPLYVSMFHSVTHQAAAPVTHHTHTHPTHGARTRLRSVGTVIPGCSQHTCMIRCIPAERRLCHPGHAPPAVQEPLAGRNCASQHSCSRHSSHMFTVSQL